MTVRDLLDALWREHERIQSVPTITLLAGHQVTVRRERVTREDTYYGVGKKITYWPPSTPRSTS